MSRTTIVMDDDLQEEAKQLGINVSEVCREAVARSIEAKKTASRLGSGGERVEASLSNPQERNEQGEKVAFYGHLVHHDERREADYYITKGGRVAVVDENGILWVSTTASLSDFIGDGFIYQKLLGALGEVVQPTELDI